MQILVINCRPLISITASTPPKGCNHIFLGMAAWVLIPHTLTFQKPIWNLRIMAYGARIHKHRLSWIILLRYSRILKCWGSMAGHHFIIIELQQRVWFFLLSCFLAPCFAMVGIYHFRVPWVCGLTAMERSCWPSDVGCLQSFMTSTLVCLSSSLTTRVTLIHVPWKAAVLQVTVIR